MDAKVRKDDGRQTIDDRPRTVDCGALHRQPFSFWCSYQKA